MTPIKQIYDLFDMKTSKVSKGRSYRRVVIFDNKETIIVSGRMIHDSGVRLLRQGKRRIKIRSLIC